MAHQVSLLPAFTLVAQIFFASIFGFLGLLLALPLTVVAKTWLQEFLIQDLLNHWDIPPKRLQTASLAPDLPIQKPGLTLPKQAALPATTTSSDVPPTSQSEI